MRIAKGINWIKPGMVTLASTALVGVIIGCSYDTPLAPSNNELDALNAITFVEDRYGPDFLAELPDSGVNAGDELAKSWWIYADADYADIGATGGTIYLSFGDATSELEVPEDAVCEDEDNGCFVRITAKAVLFETPYGPVTFYDFRPDGFEFAKSATLYLATDLEEGAELRLFWYNPQTGRWELEEADDVDESGVVKFEVNHFSKYAIS